MAEHGSDYHRGEMDIREQVSTYSLVMNMTKWGSLVIGALVLWLTLWFCTNSGFLGATVAAVVATVIGVFLLRDSRKGGH